MTTVAELIQVILSRMDSQDEEIRAIRALQADMRDTLSAHLEAERDVKPAIDQLVSLWKGSKVMSGIIGGLAAAGVFFTTMWAWAKDHIKL